MAPAPQTVPTRKLCAWFLQDKIGFLDIGRLVEGMVDSDSFGGDYTLQDVYDCDRMARDYVKAHV